MAPPIVYRISWGRRISDSQDWVDAKIFMSCGLIRFGQAHYTGGRGFRKGLAGLLGISVCEGEIVFNDIVLGQRGRATKQHILDYNPVYNHGGAKKSVVCPECGNVWVPTDGMIEGAMITAKQLLHAEGCQEKP